MAIDRRKSAAKRFEDDRKKKAAAAAKKAEQEKKAAAAKKAEKSQKQNKPVRSPGKDITTSVRDTFRGQAAKPQFGREQTAAQRMQGRSENWARLETQKAGADKSTRKKIEAAQDRLHKANRKDAKGMTFDGATGRWEKGGKPAYTPNVLPGMSRDAQRAGMERSLRNGIVAPDMQKAAKKHQDAVWDRVHGPETGERFGLGLESVGKSVKGFLPALGETLAQDARNARTDWNNPKLKVLVREASRLQRELNIRGLPTGGETRKEKAQRLQDLLRQIDEMRDKTAVDQNQYGQRMMRESAEAAQEATRGLSGATKFAADTALGIAGNAPALALSAVPVVGQGLSLGMMGGQAAAQKTAQLNARGIAPGEALARGVAAGGIEALTEKLPLDELVKVAKTGGRGAVKNVLKQMGMEATEESVSYALNYAADKIAGDPEAQFTLRELAGNALGGAVSGGILSGGATAVNRARNLPKTPLPLPVKTQETANTLPQDIQNEIDNPESAVADVKMQEPEVQTKPEAQMTIDELLNTAQETDADYRAQIDGVFDGSLPTDRQIIIGQTPDTLRSLGAPDLPITMTQSTARKIAYPAGYMGGKHNLGIPALKSLPEQLNDPLAVIQSKTQPDSFVVLTEWNDTNGNPVVAAIHMNKRGVIEDVNTLASAYGKRNLEALLGQAHENVIYTKENKSIDQILDNRLRLPELLSDDTLVAHSIAQNAGENNPQSGETVLQAAEKKPEIRTMSGTPNYEITGYTLSEDAVNLGNALAESGNPQQALTEIIEAYEPAYQKAIAAAADYIRQYQPRGTVVLNADDYGRGGYRASQNEQWYRAFYQKNGHAPRNADIPALAEQLVHADADGTQFGFPAQSAKILEAAKELQERVVTRDGFTGFTQNADGDVQALYDMQPQDVGQVAADATTGAAPSGFDPYTHAANEYGTIQPGENPARIVDVPKSMDGEDRVRRFARTTMEAQVTPDEMIPAFEQNVQNGLFSYHPKKDKPSLDMAVKTIDQLGIDGAMAQWDDVTSGRRVAGKEDIVLAELLYSKAAQMGDTQTAMKLAAEIAAEGTRAGQTVQALRLLKRTTPEGKLYYIRKTVAKLNNDLQSKGKSASKQKPVSESEIIKDSQKALDDAVHEIGDEVKNRGASLSANKTKPEQKGESKGKTAQAKQREKKSVAERLANTISSRLQPVKAPDGDAKILSDLLKFADEHALPKKQSNVPKRTPVDRLKDYFRNRERYTQEWNKAREILRDQYKDTPEALDRLESFLNATVDYNGDPLHEQKVIVSAILSDIQKDGGMQKIMEREALGAGAVSAQQISERLIADVGAQGADAQIIRDAVTRNLQEMIASRRSANIANIVRNAISRHSNSLTQIAYMPSEQRKAVGQQIATDIISRLNIPQSRIGDISDLIVDEYMNQVVSRAESILKTRFSKKARINKEFLDKFREYAALGAFDSQYSQQAAGRLFGRDDITIDTVLADELLNAKTEAEVDAAIDAIYNDIAAQVPPMFGDRLNAWRYFAMLGNPRTHIRNVVGNMVMQLPVRASNKLSASLQGALLKDPAQRTRSLKRAKGAKEFAKADYETMKGILSGESHLSETDEIRRRQKAFLIPDAQLNDGSIRSMPLKLVNNVLLRPIQAGADFSSRNLDAEDAFFKKMTYINSLADFLSARGVDLNNVPADVLEQGRTHAIEDAKKATFQDASALADAIGRIENKNKATKLVIGGLVPFKRTPINIVKRGFEYSPAGLIKGLTADLKKVRNGTMDATEAIDHIAQGLTGTAIAALGYFLASNDLLSASEPENDKEREFGAAQGSQEYALNIGDYSYTIDWAAPAALPLFVGAEFYNALTQKYDGEEQAFKQATESLSRLFEPMINMTMLSGVGSTIRSAQYSNTNPIFAVGENIVQNYAGQVVPTLLGQIARTADDTRRTTYVDKESWVPDSVQKFMQRQQNKIPGVSKKNAPYMDVFGQTDTEPNTALRAFENFLSPGYISRKKENGAIDGLRALYETTGESSALPSRADTSFRVDGEEVKLSQDEYVKFVQQRGKTMQDSLDVLFGSKSYQDMSDADKLAAVQKVFQYATAEAKTGVSAYKMDSDQERARDSGVSPGLWYGYKQQMSAREAAEQEKYTYMPEIIDQIMNEETLDDGKRQKFVQSLVIDGISDKQKDLYAAAKNDVPADVWAKTYYKFREIEETLDGTGSEKNDAKRAYLFADQGLSKEQKSILDEAMIQDALYIPKDVVVDYSSPESFVLTQMSDAAQEKFSRFGMSVQDYAKYYPIASQGGKKKAEVLEELRAAGMSAGEAESFYKTLKSKNGSSSGKSSKGKSSGGGSSGKGKTGPKLPSKPSAPKLRLP